MATRLGDVAVGTLVKIKENGVPVNYLVAQQGLPKSTTSMYDSSCTGTWVVRLEIYTTMQWGNNANDASARVNYATSTITNYLNASFKNTIDIRDHIKRVKLPYTKLEVATNGGTGIRYPEIYFMNGASGMETQVFLLAQSEVSEIYANSQDMPNLSVFKTSPSYKIAYYNGQPYTYWYRTVGVGNWNHVECNLQRYPSDTSVSYDTVCTKTNVGVRPAMILDPDLHVSDDGSVITNSPPTIPPFISLSSPIAGGKPIKISWGASTDPDGDQLRYQVARDLNGLGHWNVLAAGTPNLYWGDVIPYGSTTVQYRVNAFDTNGAYSGSRLSAVEPVINNVPPTAPASITVPTPVAGHTIDITWGAATDSDGTVKSYELFRSVNESGWTYIYGGDQLTYTDTVGGGWATVAYRVCAVDNMDDAGPYTTSETYTVSNDILYISGPAPSLGEQAKPFTFSYKVGVSGSTEPVPGIETTVTLDGYQLLSNTIETTQQVDVAMDVRAMGAGTHTIKVTAAKTLMISANETYTFTVPATTLPDGGYGTQLQNSQGDVVFPQTVAGMVAGLKGKSVGENLADLYAAVEALEGAIETGIRNYRGEG